MLDCIQATRAFSLLRCTVEFSDVRLFLGKSRVRSGRFVCTRSENASSGTQAGRDGNVAHVFDRWALRLEPLL